MGEDGDKALTHFRNCREEIEKCRDILISAQSEFKRGLLHMERIAHKTAPNTDILDDELDKMKTNVEGLNALTTDIDKLYFKEAEIFRVTKRVVKCRIGKKLITEFLYVFK